ncbi:MAG: inositol monophosphatase family protein [Candidatus Caenarcaniphilales bacterium]|nr:inositol monophosphatase family protein [Candidatus Caenarcaniphilales bacterium]
MSHEDDKLKNKLLETAVKAAIRGGRIIKQYWGDLDSHQVEEKSSWRDLVTVADKKSEEAVLKTIKSKFPDHIIISEEGGGKTETKQVSDYKWAIDPLDGTTNFRHSYPFFCVSIGIMFKDEPIVGVVYDPIRDELFTATRGGGAFLNGRRIRVSKVETLKESLLVTGFAYSVNELQQQSMELFKKLSFMTHGVRRDGAAALDLCYVAAGRLEAFWEYGLHIWDVAAGSLIVQEAEGNINDPQGQALDLFSGRILASNKLITEELLKEIKESGKVLNKA